MSTNLEKPTIENVIPSELFAPENVGLNREFIEQNGLELRDLTSGPIELKVDDLVPMEETNGIVMLGILDLGGVPLKIHTARDEQGKLYKDYITLSPADYDPSTDKVTDEAVQMRMLPIMGQYGERIIGREGNGAGRLELDKNEYVSRHHMGISIQDGILRIRDLGSTNGTSLVTAQNNHELDEQIAESPKKYETQIDGNLYKVEGSFPSNSRGDVYVMSSTDQNGQTREFMVYKSNSEGGYRSSQGFEEDGRFIKGAENNRFTQYTQDTQLHPSIQKIIESIASKKLPLPMADGKKFMASEDEVDKLMDDFESQIDIKGWPHKALNTEIARTKAGYASEAHLANHLKVSPENVPAELDDHVAKINKELEDSGFMPNFDKPERIEFDLHGHLGPITREVYTAVAGNRKIEWYMAYDGSGRVWIDRIRFAGSKATAYGTDQELIYSGILTSKPIEYAKETSGLKPEYKAGQIGEHYEEISPFLDTFAPIKKFRAERGVIRR
jgi:hypothetical protein